jgi:hypothetical protein
VKVISVVRPWALPIIRAGTHNSWRCASDLASNRVSRLKPLFFELVAVPFERADAAILLFSQIGEQFQHLNKLIRSWVGSNHYQLIKGHLRASRGHSVHRLVFPLIERCFRRAFHGYFESPLRATLRCIFRRLENP